MRCLQAIAVLALGLAACGSSNDGGTPASGPVCTTPPPTFVTTIVVTDNQFNPACAKVHPTTDIVFQNQGVLAHTATTDAGQSVTFNHSLLTNGATATQQFPSAGAMVNIHCNFHPEMRATIFVE
jgi:plastocyanin